MATVKSIIETAAAMLDMKEISFSGSQVISNYDPTVIALVKCLNNVIEEIATEYVPFEAVEEVTLNNGKFNYASLQNQVFQIVKIEDDGSPCEFICYPTFAEVDTKRTKVKVRYYYIPAKVSVTGTVNYPKLSARLLSLGVASDYALTVGRYEESVNYDKQYMYALQSAQRTRKPIRIKARRWI